MANFNIRISSPDLKKDIKIRLSSCQITVTPKEDTASYGSKCVRVIAVHRPDKMIEIRSHIYDSAIKREMSHSIFLESDPIKDPNHWLNRDDNYVLVAMPNRLKKVRQRMSKVKKK